jgi:hypothetical protein
MNYAELIKKSIPFIVGTVLFFILSTLYLKPALEGYNLQQSDYINYIGASNDVNDFMAREKAEPHWTQSMFSGMPSVQINTYEIGDNTIFIRRILSLGLPFPVDTLFLSFIGFFIMALCLRINPWVGIVGAIAFGFSTYSIILMEVGHVTKIYAISFIPPIVGAFLLTYRNKIILGGVLSALFMCFEISANHVQITFYLGMLLVALGIYQVIRAIKDKAFKNFVKASTVILFAYALAFTTGSTKLMSTMEYAKYSIRGKNDISINPDLSSNHANSTEGLDRDYVTAWSYGKWESLTFFIPDAKGGETVAVGNGKYAEKLMDADYTRDQIQYIQGSNQYWANQPYTGGTIYFGSLVFLLAILGLFFIRSKIKWPLLAISLLAIFLSWGKNLMWLTDLFLDYVPFYNKFRTVTIVLIIIQVTIPLLAMLFLNELWKDRKRILEQKKKFYIISGSILGFILLLVAFPSMTGLYSKSELEQYNNSDAQIEESVRNQIEKMPAEQLKQYGVDPNNPSALEQLVQQATKQQIDFQQNNFPVLKSFRASIFRESAMRSFFFMAMGLIFVLLILRNKAEKNNLLYLAAIAVLILVDLIGVDLNYVNSEQMDNRDAYKKWVLNEERMYPLSPSSTDEQILSQEMAGNPKIESAVIAAKQKAENYSREKEFSNLARNNYVQNERFLAYNRLTHFRVVDLTENVFNSSRTSYFHESIGGYHAAKLRNYQNLADFGYLPSNQLILGMLNTKYIVQGNGEQSMARINPYALGNAWLTKNIRYVKNNNEAILALGSIYQIKSGDKATVLINNNRLTQEKVYGRENIVALIGKDSVKINFPGGLNEGMEASFVMDINGNTNWVPASALINDTTNSFTKILDMTVVSTFQPKDEAIVLDKYKNMVGKTSFTGEGTIEATKTELNDMKYTFNSTDDQLVVFSEIYYPIGWKIKIDGKVSEIIPVNYLLRGVKVPKGKHQIEMYFENKKYDRNLAMAKISSWLIVLLFFGGIGSEIYLYTRKKNKENLAN